MKNIVKIIFPAMLMLFGVLLIAFSGCKKDTTLSTLTDTHWELVGIVDANTGEITPLAPEYGYWFKFISETKAQGRSVLNDMEVYLTTPPLIGIVTMVGDDHIGDAALFYSVIKRLESYKLEKNKLKFFYDNKRHYLLYKYSKS